jgi:copper chaperone NosL
MIITEAVPAFGGEMRMKDGSWLRFDAAECIAALTIARPRDTVGVRSMLAIDHDRPARRIDARRAWYLHSDSLPSPMALNLSAYATRAAARAARKRHGGSLLRWPEVVELVRVRWHFDRKTR